jgi:acetyl esterase/lipase
MASGDPSGPDLALWPEGAVPLATGSNPGDRPTLTPYLLPPGPARAAVVICPGGGYAGLAAHEAAPVARWANALGLHALVLRYRVAPYRHPAPLWDAQRALRTVRHRADAWAVDPDRVGLLGFSAGGHLCATAATHFDHGEPDAQDPVQRQGCRPDFVVLGYPVISLIDHAHAGSMHNLLGADPPEELRLALSAERQVTAATPPAFLWHTADDAVVPVEHSLAFAAALSRHGVPFELHIYPHGAHGLGLATAEARVGQWTQACASWLAAEGLRGAPPLV